MPNEHCIEYYSRRKQNSPTNIFLFLERNANMSTPAFFYETANITKISCVLCVFLDRGLLCFYD